jgi:hypothetical protein
MNPSLSNILIALASRRRDLRMNYPALSRRCGVSLPTLKRMFTSKLGHSSFENVAAVAHALGLSVHLSATDSQDLRRQQARRKAEQVARLVQGTSALEDQAVDSAEYNRLVERSYHEFLAGPPRRLWDQ